MNTEPQFEQRIAAALGRAASTGHPDGLLDSVLTTVGHTRMRPRWLALIKEPPMRIHSRVAAGSPALRLVTALILITLLAILATGTVVAGARLLGPPAIVVAQDGTGSFTTITEAVAVAQNGDTVLVRPGTYHESIIISEDITLIGDGDRGAVVLEFTDTDDATWAAPPDPGFTTTSEPVTYGIVLDDSDAHLENITVRGRITAEPEFIVAAVVIDGGAPVIEKVDIVLDGKPYPDEYGWVARSAFQVTGGTTAVIRDSSWDGFTRVFGSPASTPTFEDDTITGMRISIRAGGHRPTFRDNTLLDGAAILTTGFDGSAIVEGNDIVGWISAGDDTIIRHNTIRGGGEPTDGRPGSAIAISGTAIVEGNTIIDSPYGIDISARSTPRISGNTIRGSTTTAILVDSGTVPTIDQNTIEGNNTGIAVLGVNTTPVLTGNTFCDN
ncbi:MAG: pectinesterase family protein, partial [Candidatus Limnocylindrales bacterium]